MSYKVQDKVSQMLALRKAGKSINEIAVVMQVSKATACCYVGHISLAREKKKATPVHRAAISAAVTSWCANNPVVSMKRMQVAQLASNMAFTSHEQSMLPKLQARYGSLSKEKIGGHWADFANQDVIIELTIDYGKGITNAIERHELRWQDDRRKILVCNSRHFGDKRRQRAQAAGVEIVYLGSL